MYSLHISWANLSNCSFSSSFGNFILFPLLNEKLNFFSHILSLFSGTKHISKLFYLPIGNTLFFISILTNSPVSMNKIVSIPLLRPLLCHRGWGGFKIQLFSLKKHFHIMTTCLIPSLFFF